MKKIIAKYGKVKTGIALIILLLLLGFLLSNGVYVIELNQ